jgi:sugar-specific transcriptional regulator TrmB
MAFRIPFTQRKPSDTIKGYVQLTLTPEGIREAENFDGTGEEFEVLAALLQKRPQSIGDLARASNMPFPRCMNCCKELKNKGLVSQISRQQ